MQAESIFWQRCRGSYFPSLNQTHPGVRPNKNTNKGFPSMKKVMLVAVLAVLVALVSYAQPGGEVRRGEGG